MFSSANYLIAVELFIRLLGLVYFFVFAAFLFQMKGLFGKNGILPIARYLEWIEERVSKKRFYYIPSLFWWFHSDKALMFIPALGTLLSILLFFGIYPPLLLALLFLLHLSIVSAGQDFLSFGWESLLLEITLNAFLVSLMWPPNPWAWASLNLLLFRFHFEAGISKLHSRDLSWRDLTAVKYHYESQPLPNTLAWYVHKFPMWFHKASTAIMLVIELIVPFAIFGTQEMRLFAFVCFFGLQLFIWLTGNFSYLNHMTAVFSVILISNVYLEPVFGKVALSSVATNLLLFVLVSIAGATLVTLQLLCIWYHFSPPALVRSIISKFYSFHIANPYGLFSIMTKQRDEIVIVGSDDGIHWEEYSFKFKPSELNRRPKRVSPYQPRIDWQAWFLPFSYFEAETWFQNFLVCILEGKPEVLDLLHHNPFPEKPPKYVQALVYEYKFSDWETKKNTGNWWVRTYLTQYSPRLELRHHA